MAGARPSRGARVVYREIDSDDSDYEYDDFTKVVLVDNLGEDDDSNDVDFCPTNSGGQEVVPTVVYPELSPVQKELKKVCRLGDKALLKSFLSDHPNIELDVKDVDGGTLLTEAATKTAQFSDIVEVLVEAGAGLSVCDSLGNTPLHNAVLYFPSTQKSVDLLLNSGANVTIKNNEGVLAEGLAEDKDLKYVLKELRKAAGRKKSTSLSVSHYLNSPELRKKVFDKALMEETFNRRITIKYNDPIMNRSPGLLKRKRDSDNLNDSHGGREKKRIRWSPLEDPQFSSEEEEGSISQDTHDNVPYGIDSEEDVVIVHKDFKNSCGLNSATEVTLDTGNFPFDNLHTVTDLKDEEDNVEEEKRPVKVNDVGDEKDLVRVGDVVEEKDLVKVEEVGENPSKVGYVGREKGLVKEEDMGKEKDHAKVDDVRVYDVKNEKDPSGKEIDLVRMENVSPTLFNQTETDDTNQLETSVGAIEGILCGGYTNHELEVEDNNKLSQAETNSRSDSVRGRESLMSEGDENKQMSPSNQNCDTDAEIQREELSAKDEDSESDNVQCNENNIDSEDSEEQNQVIIKCSQGFGFFVDG